MVKHHITSIFSAFSYRSHWRLSHIGLLKRKFSTISTFFFSKNFLPPALTRQGGRSSGFATTALINYLAYSFQILIDALVTNTTKNQLGPNQRSQMTKMRHQNVTVHRQRVLRADIPAVNRFEGMSSSKKVTQDHGTIRMIPSFTG